MKINEIVNKFEIFVSNEEKEVLEKMQGTRPMEAYSERERFVIENLIRKSLVSKVRYENTYMVRKNEQRPPQ
jgi:hypothetical protein